MKRILPLLVIALVLALSAIGAASWAEGWKWDKAPSTASAASWAEASWAES